MKCPIDQTEMEKGIFANYMWISGDRQWGSLWTLPFSLNFPMRKKLRNIAYRCPKCGKLELYTEPDKKEEE